MQLVLCDTFLGLFIARRDFGCVERAVTGAERGHFAELTRNRDAHILWRGASLRCAAVGSVAANEHAAKQLLLRRGWGGEFGLVIRTIGSLRLAGNAEQKRGAENGCGGEGAQTGGYVGEGHNIFLFSFAKSAKRWPELLPLIPRFALLENQLRITTYYNRFLVAT